VRITVLEADADTVWQRSIAATLKSIPGQEAGSIWGERISSLQRFTQFEGCLDPDEARRAYRVLVPVPSHRPGSRPSW
jgi:hypothetical protein